MNETVDAIVELDRENMSPIIAESGGMFSESRRKNKLIEEISNGSVVLTHYQNRKLAGYVQYMPLENDEFYVLSIQVHPKYRNGIVLKKLLKSAANDLLQRKPLSITSSVHRENKPSIRLHERLGFMVTSGTTERINFTYSGVELESKLKKLAGTFAENYC